MWDSIKEDPILKTIIVIILGVLAFGFAFNVMFGSNSSGMESAGMMGGGSYSLGNTLSLTLSLLIKIALIVIVVGAIIAGIKYFKKYVIDETKFTAPDLSDKKTLYKYVLYGVGTLLVLVVISSLMNGTSSSNVAAGTMQNTGYYAANTGSRLSILSILVFFSKTLLFISTAGLLVAVFMYLKNEYLNKNVNVANAINEKKTEKNCSKCGLVLKESWKCCPNCGDEIKITLEKDSKIVDTNIIEPLTIEGVSKGV